MSTAWRLSALALGIAIGAVAASSWGLAFLALPQPGERLSDGARAAALGPGTATKGAGAGTDAAIDLAAAGPPLAAAASSREPFVVPPPPDAAARPGGRWATVLEVRGANALRIRDESGTVREVEHIGVMGPGPGQRRGWRERATRAHEALVGGRRILVEGPAGRGPRDRSLPSLAHVFVEGELDAPVSARLLAGGNAWVYPNTPHHLAQWFADLQAEAVRGQAGLWAEGGSHTLWRPRDGQRGGFPVDSRIVPALYLLAADPIGRSVLAAAERFPPEIRFSRLSEGTLGLFARREFSVAVAERWAGSDPVAVAGVLVHELRHVGDLIASGIIDVDTGCFEGEERAFETATLFWFGRYGLAGKQPAQDGLDRNLNDSLRQYRDGRLNSTIRAAYGHRCAR